MEQTTKLKRELGFTAATSIVVGCVIGSGVFVKPASVLASVGGTNSALLAWLFGGLISIAGGLTIAEVAARIPKTGGVYAYIEEIYGNAFGFYCGWVQSVIYGPGLMAALSLYFGLLARPLLGLEEAWQPILSFGALAVLVTVNCIGARYAGMVQEITTFIKLLPIAVIAVCGLLWGSNPALNVSVETVAVGSLGGAILSTLWAYDGWMQVANVAGEMKNPARDLPRAIIVGLLIVAAAYLAVNYSLLSMLGAETLAKAGPDAARVAATGIFGSAGGALISVGIVISIFGCLNGNILSNTRVPYAMARRNELPFSSWIGRVHPVAGTPNNATILQSMIAVVMMLMLGREIDQITDLAIFSIYIFFTLAFMGLFILRRREKVETIYRVPLYPFIPLVAVGGSLFMLISKIVDQPQLGLYFLLLAALGLPVRLMMAAPREEDRTDTAPVYINIESAPKREH